MRQKKQIAILKKEETLEEKTSNTKTSHIPKTEKEVVEEMIGSIKVSDKYKKIEKDLKKQQEEEKKASDLGFKPDNYYSAKQKEDEEDELGRTEEAEHSGSFGSRRG